MGATSSCARLVVSGEGVSAESSRFSLERGAASVVAVAQSTLPVKVTVQAVGYLDVSCLERSGESSALEAVTFPESGILDVFLSVEPAVAGLDGGRDGGTDAGPGADGGFTPDSGGPDGGSDAGPRCATCAGGSACNGQVCGGVANATLASCDNGVCRERACGNNLDDNGANGIDCSDSDCAAKACGTGSCVGSLCTSEINCSDGVDNDSNGKTDCLDPSCDAKSCTDGLSCSVNEVCGSQACGGGAARVCPPPPSVCLNAGVCSEPNGCAYTVNSGATCDDGLLCTLSDTCAADGGCVGTPRVCNAPPGMCFQPIGTCLEGSGACHYAPIAGSCNDGQNCTTADACDSTGACVGQQVTCTPGECQTTTGTCTAGGACIFAPQPGAACGSGRGRCTALGTCVNLFPYAPSNFTTDQLADAGVTLTVACPVIIDTGTGAQPKPQVRDGGQCLSAALPWRLIQQAGTAQPALLITLDGLTIPPTGSMHFDGDAPVIIAVLGSATIAGAIDVSATTLGSGAGGRVCGSGNGGNATGGTRSYSGGGGGGYGTSGGMGGQGHGGFGPLDGGVPGAGGVANASATLVPLRGGCFGGDGKGALITDFGRGAFAAGAVQISASGSLTVAGQVSAAGGGGRGATNDNGGGGGGSSGGGVLLEGQLVVVSGAVTANGGAGGCGAGNSSDGSDGPPGSATTATPAAVVSCGTTSGGIGGSGAAGSTAATSGGPNQNVDHGGGAGGGAGVGRIRVNSVDPCNFSGVRSPIASSAQATCR